MHVNTYDPCTLVHLPLWYSRNDSSKKGFWTLRGHKRSWSDLLFLCLCPRSLWSTRAAFRYVLPVLDCRGLGALIENAWSIHNSCLLPQKSGEIIKQSKCIHIENSMIQPLVISAAVIVLRKRFSIWKTGLFVYKPRVRWDDQMSVW